MKDIAQTISVGVLLAIFAPHLSWIAAFLACFCIAVLLDRPTDKESGERNA
jgi:hypothetical protein